MLGVERMHDARALVAESIGTIAARRGLRVATAESLTGGLLASDLARVDESASWFRGGLVSGADGVEHDVLCMRPGPLGSERVAVDMADGVALLLGASTTVAVSGQPNPRGNLVGPPMTVWIAARDATGTSTSCHHLAGDPDEVRAQVCVLALAGLLHHITAGPRPS